jgi:hypothetical protein
VSKTSNLAIESGFLTCPGLSCYELCLTRTLRITEPETESIQHQAESDITCAAGVGRDAIQEMALVDGAGQLWMSYVTMQGMGTDQSIAIEAFSNVHAECAYPCF